MLINKNGSKRLRIIFTAIKKDALEKNMQSFEGASISINVIEPSPISLLRSLTLNNLIPQDQTIALVMLEPEIGQIVIVNNGVPQFVREFQLRINTAKPDQNDPQALLTRLTNEIRVSLDYINRQDLNITVGHISFLAEANGEEFSNTLGNELKISANSIDIKSILRNQKSQSLEILYAFGTSLFDSVPIPAQFNLSSKKIKPVKMNVSSPKDLAKFKSAFLTALICIPLICMAFFISSYLIGKEQKKVEHLNQQLGLFKSASTEIIDEKNDELKKKISILSDIRLNSDVFVLLSTLPDLMPDGIWIKRLNINYSDKVKKFGKKTKKRKLQGNEQNNETIKHPPILEFDGFAYFEISQEQFRLVNSLIKNLKENELFSKFFVNIDLVTVKTQEIKEYTVTAFKIKCQ